MEKEEILHEPLFTLALVLGLTSCAASGRMIALEATSRRAVTAGPPAKLTRSLFDKPLDRASN